MHHTLFLPIIEICLPQILKYFWTFLWFPLTHITVLKFQCHKLVSCFGFEFWCFINSVIWNRDYVLSIFLTILSSFWISEIFIINCYFPKYKFLLQPLKIFRLAFLMLVNPQFYVVYPVLNQKLQIFPSQH